jgi:molybdopterin converting factor subunit 1
MIVVVQLFARARDLAGAAQIRVELPEGATVAQLREQIASQLPGLTSLLERSAIAVDNEFAQPEQSLDARDEIALLPPVSGGCG